MMEESNQQIPAPNDFYLQLPPEARFHRSRLDSSGFVTVLWNMLNWVGQDNLRSSNLGLRWISNDEFLMDKNKFVSVTQIPVNSLNFKLRTYKFTQSQKRQGPNTFWRCEHFCMNSTPEDLKKIDQKRQEKDENMNIMPQALYLPLLESVFLYTQKASDVSLFKCDVIFLWQDIIGQNSIWAVERVEFINAIANRFCKYFIPTYRDASAFDAQQTEFAQYLRVNNLDLMATARQMIAYVLIHEKPNLISLLDFCMFFARFGPEDSVLEKIHQLLCCSKTFGEWFLPGVQKFDPAKLTSGSYSNTFANCFIIKHTKKITLHIYNLTTASTNNGFLTDESGKKYLTWHAVFENLNIPLQRAYPDSFLYDPMEQS